MGEDDQFLWNSMPAETEQQGLCQLQGGYLLGMGHLSERFSDSRGTRVTRVLRGSQTLLVSLAGGLPPPPTGSSNKGLWVLSLRLDPGGRTPGTLSLKSPGRGAAGPPPQHLGTWPALVQRSHVPDTMPWHLTETSQGPCDIGLMPLVYRGGCCC